MSRFDLNNLLVLANMPRATFYHTIKAMREEKRRIHLRRIFYVSTKRI
jgi:hypothetical protein